MGVLVDITGKQFGYWKVLYRNGSTANKASIWKCECTLCHKIYDVIGASLRTNKSTCCLSCSAKTSHTKSFSKDPIKIVFLGMKERCLNKNSDHYKYYGGRGITICNEWLEDSEKFYKWAYKNGYKKGLTIDRINPDKNYEPSNCRFITLAEQQRNKKNVHKFDINGITKSFPEWCEIYKINRSTVLTKSKRKNISLKEAFLSYIK